MPSCRSDVGVLAYLYMMEGAAAGGGVHNKCSFLINIKTCLECRR